MPLRSRSGVELEQLRSLVEWSGGLADRVQWINLQDGPAAKAERAALEHDLVVPIHDWPAAQAHYDIDDVAARIAALDLVISAGGVAGHLAGALGVPAWIVVRQDDQWRWLGQWETTPWYPSVRLFAAPKTAPGPSSSEGGGSGSPSGSTNTMERLCEELLKRLESTAEKQGMRSIAPPHWHPDAFGSNASRSQWRTPQGNG